MSRRIEIKRFNLSPGSTLAHRYRVVAKLGGGYEGEVYQVRERGTGIERTAKIWYPQRNVRGVASRRYAVKLHKLRHCPILIQYSHSDHAVINGVSVRMLVSDYVEGEVLNVFIARQPGKRLIPFQAAHLLYALVKGIEQIHQAGEYHGDLHPANVIVQRHGLSFDLKLVDLYNWGPASGDNFREDMFDAIRVFYDALGGQKHYRKQPPEVKEICAGLKRTLIRKRFRRISDLRVHLENMEWS